MVKLNDENPRSVSRGLKIQKIQNVFLGVDSLYLVIEYPHANVFNYWSRFVPDKKDKRLYDGIPHEDMLIRRGGLGYPLSIWSGDSRLFITEWVDEKLVGTPQEGQGMGLMLQLGSKWLRQNSDFTSYDALTVPIFDLLRDFGVSEPENYPIRINRLDVALDVGGLAVADFSIEEWNNGWVGRAASKNVHFDKTGKLSGFSIGTSQGGVHLTVYDKISQSSQDKDLFFWLSVWMVNFGELEKPAVARFEWSFKPHEAKFIGMRYLSDYTFDGLKELLNYVTKSWGRLCYPQLDKNPSRREIHPLWETIRRMMIEEWDIDHVGMAKRDYHTAPDLTNAYLSSVTGWLGGLMARVGLAKGYDAPADIYEAVMMAQEASKPIDEKANEKWEILSRLHGKKGNIIDEQE